MNGFVYCHWIESECFDFIGKCYNCPNRLEGLEVVKRLKAPSSESNFQYDENGVVYYKEMSESGLDRMDHVLRKLREAGEKEIGRPVEAEYKSVKKEKKARYVK